MMPSKSVAKVGREEDGDLEGVRHVEQRDVAEAVGDARDDAASLSTEGAIISELRFPFFESAAAIAPGVDAEGLLCARRG